MPSLEELTTMLTPWWPLVMQMLLFWYLTQWGKKNIWTRKRAHAGKSGVMLMLRDTKGLHPIVWGAAWGALYPHAPAVEAATTMGEAIMWGMGAGIGSLAGHKIVLNQAEKRGWLGVVSFMKTAGNREASVPPPPKDTA